MDAYALLTPGARSSSMNYFKHLPHFRVKILQKINVSLCFLKLIHHVKDEWLIEYTLDFQLTIDALYDRAHCISIV